MYGDTYTGYAKPHVWNLVAKVLRETPANDDPYDDDYGRQTHEAISLAFADRFERDEGFDRVEFLKACGI